MGVITELAKAIAVGESWESEAGWVRYFRWVTQNTSVKTVGMNGTERAIEEAYRKIKTINVSVGGYFGGYYDVTIDLTNLETTWSCMK